MIKVDVVSDVVCPWCYIGKRRLEKAIEILSNRLQFDVKYHPFELNPDMPLSGHNHKEYLTKKFGSESRYNQLTQHVTEVAKSEGLEFNYHKQRTAPNTRNSHRLIWLAAQYDKQAAMKEALMKAYFTDGLDLSVQENLIGLAEAQGLSIERVRQMLDSDEGMAEVQLAETVNRQRGISGVPFYIINNRHGVSGAQPTDTFVQAFEEITSKVSTGEQCDIDGTNC